MDKLVELAIALGYTELKPEVGGFFILLYVQAALNNNLDNFNRRIGLLTSDTSTENKKQSIVDAEKKCLTKQELTSDDLLWIDVRALYDSLYILQAYQLQIDILGKVLALVDFDSIFNLTAPNPIVTRYKATLCLTKEGLIAYFQALLTFCQEYNEPVSFMLMNNDGYHMVFHYDPNKQDYRTYYLGSSADYWTGLQLSDSLWGFNLIALTGANSLIPQDALIACMQTLKTTHFAIQQNQPVPEALFQLAIASSDTALVRQICDENDGIARVSLPNLQLPLHYSAMVAGVEMMNTLLNCGARALQPNDFGGYAISSAILLDNPAAIERLLVPSRSILSVANKDGMTPILVAISCKRPDIANRLFDTALLPVTAAIIALESQDETKAMSQTLQSMKQELTEDFTALLALNGPPKVLHNVLMSIACQFGTMVETISRPDLSNAQKSNAIKLFLENKDVKAWTNDKDRKSWSLFGASVFTSGLLGALSALIFPPVALPVFIATAAGDTSRQLARRAMRYLGFWPTSLESGAKALEASYQPNP